MSRKRIITIVIIVAVILVIAGFAYKQYKKREAERLHEMFQPGELTGPNGLPAPTN